MIRVIDYIIITLIFIVLFTCSTKKSQCHSQDRYKSKPKTFSSTQTWCPEYKKKVLSNTDINNWKIVNGTLSFPLNNSTITNDELRYLYQLKTSRNETLNSIIVSQVSLDGILRSIDIENVLSSSEEKNLYNFLENVLSVIIFTLKNYHDRVRPSFLSDSLDIEEVLGENPCHPSYPSGHATQAWIIAYLIIDFLEQISRNVNKTKYLKRAESVAKGREIAGVHYPTDSEYGKHIAYNLVDKIFNGSNNPIIRDFSRLTAQQINKLMIDGVLP